MKKKPSSLNNGKELEALLMDIENDLVIEIPAVVKLIFRFAAEDADRGDNECERMWVQVQETDEDGNYVGILSNAPLHDAATNGDGIHFNPLHIAEVS